MECEEHGIGVTINYDGYIHTECPVCEELQELTARISDLESQVNIIADENQSLEKRIEEKDVEIERLKQPIPESPELVKARADHKTCTGDKCDCVVHYIAALESDNARLRGAGKPVVDGSNTEID
jgi:archaellum component FlaC